MSDQPIPEAAFEIQGTDVCERSRIDGHSQGEKKKPFYPFSVLHVMTLSFFSSLQTIFKALPTFRSTYMGHVAAARKRSHQWCVSLTPNNTWVAFIA